MWEYILLDMIGIVERGGVVETPDNFFVRLRAGLNKLGKERWELCASLHAADPPILVFKRTVPLISEEKANAAVKLELDTK
jgi:hypothetical protein